MEIVSKVNSFRSVRISNVFRLFLAKMPAQCWRMWNSWQLAHHTIDVRRHLFSIIIPIKFLSKSAFSLSFLNFCPTSNFQKEKLISCFLDLSNRNLQHPLEPVDRVQVPGRQCLLQAMLQGRHLCDSSVHLLDDENLTIAYPFDYRFAMEESNDTHTLTQALRSTFEITKESKHSRERTSGVSICSSTTTTTNTNVTISCALPLTLPFLQFTIQTHTRTHLHANIFV